MFSSGEDAMVVLESGRDYGCKRIEIVEETTRISST
jgi:hypothetical protein